MLLDDKIAIIWGGAGAIGAAVAQAFAAEGAKVHLAGRSLVRLEAVAAVIRAAGGTAEVAEVDALDEAQVDAHVDAVVAADGRVDIAFDLISVQDVQGTPLIEMSLADFERPIRIATRTAFLTSRAAGRHMARQGSGVILAFGGVGDPLRNWNLGGFQIALQAVVALQNQLAAELGPKGVRVVTLQTGGVVDSIPEVQGADAIRRSIAGSTVLGRAATFEDVGAVAAFAASDKARMLTGTSINMTAGATWD